MARTESKMLALGTIAPDFYLLDTISDQMIRFTQIQSEVATVVMFICNHCPFVLHVNEEMVRVAKDYQSKGISFVGISSNDVENYPQDGPDKMKIHAKEVGYNFPYLYDESQEVAKAYDAACTPDFYVFDKAAHLVYRGQLDNSRPGNSAPTDGRDLRAALDALLEDQKIDSMQRPSVGCNIKWKN